MTLRRRAAPLFVLESARPPAVEQLVEASEAFGKQSDQAVSTRLADQCIDGGITFFDTANMYSAGVAETMLGNALKGRRDKVVVASKVRFKMGTRPMTKGSPAPPYSRRST